MHHKQLISRPARAFALPELLFLLVLLVLLVTILAIGTSESRRRAQLAGSIGNLHQLAAGYASFAADNQDEVCTFQAASLTDAATEAVQIMRRLSGRPGLPNINLWLPHLRYSHLALLDYLNVPIPTQMIASPGDATLLAWQRDPVNFLNLPGIPDNSPISYRWAYSSSYELGPCFFAPDVGTGPVPTVAQAAVHNQFTFSAALTFGGRRMSEARFPGQKAMMWESYQRFFGPRTAYFAYDEARVPVLFVDGSASVRVASDANPGFQPNNPASPSPTQYLYAPNTVWEPPTLSGGASDAVIGRFRWTRGGLPGRDFGGPEAP